MRLGTLRSTTGRPSYRPALVVGDDVVVDVEAAIEEIPDGGEVARRRRDAEAEAPCGAWWVAPPGLEACETVADLVGGRAGPGTDEPSYTARLADVSLGPPVPRPGKMLAVGRNYASHLREGQRVWGARGRSVDRPPFPSGFAKFASALAGDGEALALPAGVAAVDYEIELGVVIGRHAHRVGVEEALDHIAGYTVVNDVSARAIQLEEMEQLGILISKNFPTFAPMGPWIATPNELGPPDDLALELRVNGKVRQRARTSEMLFSVAEVVASWSRIGLEPGDVILTGTPGGVALGMPDPEQAYLRDGDLVEASIDGIGTLVSPVIAEPRQASAPEVSASGAGT